MSLQLVESIRTYFDISNGVNTLRIADCFSPDAVVFDEGSKHRGHADIHSWQQATRKTFEYNVEPISASRQGEQITVIARVTGNFPGSPVQLNHLFQLDDGKIQSLEIQ